MAAQPNHTASQGGTRGFNLSQWAIDHPALTRYLMIVLMVLGVASYFQLGQDEDPPFTFRAMVWWFEPIGRAPRRSRWPTRSPTRSRRRCRR